MIPELKKYYSNNYSKCNLSDNYLSTRKGLAYPNHIIQIIAAPLQLFIFYIISKKTPKVMKTMKWPLLINHFCSTWFDVEMCTLSTPYIILTIPSFFGVGILSSLGIPYTPQLAIVFLSACCFASSYVLIFESRSNALSDNRFRMKRKRTRVLYHALVLSINLTVLLSMFVATTEESEKLKALKIDPCPTKEFFQFPLVFFIADPLIRNVCLFLWIPALFIQTSLNIGFHLLCTIYNLFIAPPTRSISPETRRAQRHFLFGIMMQTSIPALNACIPPLVSIFLLAMDNYSQEVMNLSMILFGLNGLVESLAILLVYRPYRNAMKDILNFRKLKEPIILSVSVPKVIASSSIGRSSQVGQTL